MADLTNNKYNGWTNYETWAVMLELVNDNMEEYYEIIKGQGLQEAEDSVREYVWDFTTGSDRYTEDMLLAVDWEEVVDAIDQWYNDNFCSWCGDTKFEKDHAECVKKERFHYLYD